MIAMMKMNAFKRFVKLAEYRFLFGLLSRKLAFFRFVLNVEEMRQRTIFILFIHKTFSEHQERSNDWDNVATTATQLENHTTRAVVAHVHWFVRLTLLIETPNNEKSKMKIKYKTIGHFLLGIAVTAILGQFFYGNQWRTLLLLPIYIAAFYLGKHLGRDLFNNEK